MKDSVSVGFVLALIAFLVIVGPIITIWAINTMFNLNIEYTLSTWAAALWLTGMVSAKLKQ